METTDGLRRPLRWVGALAAAFAICAAAIVGAPSAEAATTPPDDSVLVPDSGAYFGSTLDWSGDSAADQAARLGSPSAVYAHSASAPMTEREQTYIAQFVDQVHAQGALPVITLAPSVPLATIDSGFADQLAADLLSSLGSADAPAYISFAPDMNSTWREWGQQSADYVDAYRAVADAVHTALPAAAMVWSPTWGGSYPFTDSREATTDILRDLDTTGDGVVDGTDDPYGPYYPGDDAVDWVGLSLYHDDSAGGPAVNTLPRASELTDRLGPTTPTDDTADDQFYARFAEGAGKPLLLDTAALYSPSAGGANELDVKRAWWQQVFAAVSDDAYDRIDVVLWRDTTATRAVVGEFVIDWSITLGAPVRNAFRADIATSDVVLGPVTDPTGSAEGSATGTTVSGVWGWLVVAATALAAGLLFWRAAVSRNQFRRVYSGPGNRDLRIDMLRGIAIVFVVVNHISLVSLLQNGTQEAIGVVSGAELFVLLSGLVLGMVYRPKLIAGGIGEVVIRTGRRAWKLYYTALGVILLIFFLSLLPFITGDTVTTYTDEGTGGGGAGSSGRIYNLYTNAEQLLGYPVNPQIIVDLVLLRLGPWQFNVMGLYVVLLIVSPLILWALSRRWWGQVLAVSVGLYVLDAFGRFRILPSQFEDSFPLLTWQLLFVLGMLAGFYRRELVAWFRTRAGLIVLGASTAIAVVLMIFSWSNPYLSSPYDVRLGILSDNLYRQIYEAAFQRTYLEPGRLLNVILIVIVGYALLSAYWQPINKALGWFFIPLGQATLYVFIMHVFFALAAANIPVLQTGSVWVNTLAYLVALALLWVMVKTKFLFSIVPR